MRTVIGCSVAGTLSFVVASPVMAQGLEEIVVTATRREESLQDVPIAVSVVSGQMVQQGGFADIEDLSAFLPNLQIQDGFQGQTLLIRGIGTDTRNEAFEQAVAQFADGVYYGRDNLVLGGLFDLERLEVVRGPQPVFAGQSATAGAINSYSRKPGDAVDGNVMLQYGNDEERSLEGAFGGPVTDTLGIRVAGRYYELPDAGYTQLVTGAKIGATENESLRVTALWEPTDTFDFTFKYEYQNSFQNGTPVEYGRCDLDLATSSAGPLAPGVPSLCALESMYGLADLTVYNREAHSGGTVDLWDAIDFVNAELGAGIAPLAPIPRGLDLVEEYNHPESRETDADIYVGSFNWQVGRNTLSGTTAYVAFDKEDWLDPDESAFAVFTDQRGEDFEQVSQELRLTSPLDQAFSWMVGAYWQTHEANLFINVHYPFLLGPPVPGFVASSDGGRMTENSDWASLFFTGTWSVTDDFRINIGARYQESKKNGVYTISRALLPDGAAAFDPRVYAPAPALDADVDSDDVLPEIGVQWNPVDSVMVYAKYAEAFKAGGFVMNPPLGGVPPNPFTYLPEEASGYEVGFKGTFLDNNLELNVAWFDTDFDNLQVNSFNGVTARFEVRNAASSNTKGIEIDGRLAIGDSWSISFNGARNDAVYTRFPNGQCGAIQARDWQAAGNPGPCVVDISGRRPTASPEWQAGIHPQYFFRLGEFSGTAGLNMTWIAGSVPANNPGDTLNTIASRHRFDLRVALMPPSGRWELALYGRDITDEAAHVGGLQSGFFNQTLGTTDSDLHLYGVGGRRFERGARWGLQASYFFGR
ncbi:MAG: TonB-dependent receptor [Gammaproteobacteria bacterium]|nr:TonB-dependent receptor [Gammaproteobacteria bacterium]